MLMRFRCAAAVLLVVLLLGIGLRAAQATASVSGLVLDQTGAAVSAARVELAQGDRVILTVATDSSGRYRGEGLQPNEYTVRITAPGFQSAARRVNVGASGNVVADFRLDLPALQENVVVSAEQLRAEVEA
ncbi:MAG: carboxypeptidase-like regulatory domain-containing protein [Vicinamibacterales bacterium]